MNAKEMKRLKVGQRVRWADAAEGAVIETGYNAVKIQWDDGQVGIVHHRSENADQMARVEKE